MAKLSRRNKPRIYVSNGEWIWTAPHGRAGCSANVYKQRLALSRFCVHMDRVTLRGDFGLHGDRA